ncbi:DUF5333 domain-containing protein [Cognatishimia sp. F0-27]|uniref:DUF5333 domain-containing protein n=1 Tax=Cognatishimia sp. F0-27 TaxID=2816855 RepID=UPI001D0CBCE7|nr:DUF5333 domain-containing protein [Cognatishimia sp. F0-27]MCC1492310.1 DUF5333 domain-containing protein [Cognatishimia sp. F0-27]
MRLVSLMTLGAFLALPALAKPPLSSVSSIDNGLMAVAIADEIRKTCDGIDARMLRALSTLNALKAEARSLGYSDDEIEDYVTSKNEKRRMRAKAEAYLASQGVDSGDSAALCRFGAAEIARASAIGVLLR